MRSVKSQNLSLFWDNLIDITSGDENENVSDDNNDNKKEKSKNNIFNINSKSEISKKDTIKFLDNSKQSSKLETSKSNIKTSFETKNPKNDISINIDEDISVCNVNKINNNINTNSQDNILFNSLNFVTNDEVSKQSDPSDKNKNDQSSFSSNLNILKKTENINNNISLIEDNINDGNFYEDNKPLFYKYDLIVNNANQEFYDEGRIIDEINEEKGKIKNDKNEKRSYNSAFDKNDSENEEEENKETVIKDGQNDYHLIDELKIEAVVSFSDNLISNRKLQSISNSTPFNGVNFKKFKKSKFIKNNDIIYRNSLFYYEDNKISEEWLLDNDNETKEKKNLSAEAILVKTNTLLNSHTLKDGNIDSMFNSISSTNNNTVNNNIFVEDDNNHIHLTNNDVKKRKTTKRMPNKKQTKNEIIISDSDDDDDEKFVWN